MIRRCVVAAASVLLLAGCTTTVPGTPVADPSGVPRPETGSYATTAREVAPMTTAQQVAAEGFRMMEIIPLGPDVDPALRYGSSPGVGKISGSTKVTFGDGIGTALADAEVAAFTSTTDRVPGGDSLAANRSLVMGLYRFPDEAAARAAVANPALLAPEKLYSGDVALPKQEVSVPGYPAAKAFTRTREYTGGTKTVTSGGLLASGRFVLAAWTSWGDVAVMKKFFDLQLKSLAGFTPTPVDKFSTLTRDHDDMLRYTLALKSASSYEATVTARGALPRQTDVTASQKSFADAGIDYVASALTTLYRARDAAGAALLRDRFVDEMKTFYTGATDSKVAGVPGGRCVVYPAYKGSKDTRTMCVAAVGRYLVEASEAQQQLARQQLGASYLVLREAK